MKKIAIIIALIALCAALTSCGIMIEILDSMLEHDHKYTYTLEPGEDGGFNLVGRCPFEYCENPTDITYDVEVYISSVEDGDCIAGGNVVYSHDFDGQTVSYTLKGEGGEHKLCGLPVSKFYINGSMIDSSVPGVSIINEASARCGGTADASYVCDACDQTQSVIAHVSHKGVWTVKTAPTCTVDGRETIECQRCLTHIERDIPAYGHNHEVTVVNNTNGTSDITCFCTVAGCSVKQLAFRGVTGFVEVSRTDPTCTESGSIVYNYTMNGSLSAITISKRPLEHSLGGSAVSASRNSDGSIDFGIKGVSVINQSQIVCGNLTGGYYCCESCDTPVSTTVYIRPHHFESSDKWVITPATCQQQGSVTKSCKYCSYKISEPTHSDSLDSYHNVQWSVTLIGNNISTAIASGRCQNAGCSLVVAEGTIDKGSYSFNTTTATCDNAGEITHSWTVNGVPVQYKTTNLAVGHTIKDNDGKKVPAWTIVDENGYYDYSFNAINLFAGGSISCGNTADANYRCADCGAVSRVTAIQHHKMEERSTVAAGCTTNGYKLLKCVFCGVQDSEIIFASHKLEYEHDLEKNCLRYKCVKNSSDCNYSETVLDLSAGKLAVREITPSTCCTYGIAEYTFFYTPAGSYVETSITFTGKLALGSHTIKDNSGKKVNADTLCDANGHFDSSLDAIKYFAGSSAPSVGMTANGYYRCESCGDISQVTVINTGKE